MFHLCFLTVEIAPRMMALPLHLGRQTSDSNEVLYHDLWEALVEKAGIPPEYFVPRKGSNGAASADTAAMALS
jgi:hypothetical protein